MANFQYIFRNVDSKTKTARLIDRESPLRELTLTPAGIRCLLDSAFQDELRVVLRMIEGSQQSAFDASTPKRDQL